MSQLFECAPTIFPPMPLGGSPSGVFWQPLGCVALGDCSGALPLEAAPVVRAEDEEDDEDEEDAGDAEIVPPSEPLETTSDFDEDDFDDEFDDDFEEEFDEEDLGSEAGPDDADSDGGDDFEGDDD